MGSSPAKKHVRGHRSSKSDAEYDADKKEHQNRRRNRKPKSEEKVSEIEAQKTPPEWLNTKQDEKPTATSYPYDIATEQRLRKEKETAEKKAAAEAKRKAELDKANKPIVLPKKEIQELPVESVPEPKLEKAKQPEEVKESGEVTRKDVRKAKKDYKKREQQSKRKAKIANYEDS